MHELKRRGPANAIEALRIEIFDAANALGIGAQGLGGLSTVLDVKILDYPTHAASKPVGMIPNCAATRHAHFTLDGSGAAKLDPPDLSRWPDVQWTPAPRSKRVDLDTLTREEVARWQPGDRLLLTGKLLTGRDAAHKRIADLFAKGQPLPPGVDFTNRAIYYVGPVDPVREEVVGPAGPTTSTRMDKFTDMMLAKTGLLVMVGKAERGPVAIEAIRKHGAAYLMAVGGAAYLVSKAIKSFAHRRLRRPRHGSDLRIRGQGHAGDRCGRCSRHVGARIRPARVAAANRQDTGDDGLRSASAPAPPAATGRQRAPDLHRSNHAPIHVAADLRHGVTADGAARARRPADQAQCACDRPDRRHRHRHRRAAGGPAGARRGDAPAGPGHDHRVDVRRTIRIRGRVRRRCVARPGCRKALPRDHDVAYVAVLDSRPEDTMVHGLQRRADADQDPLPNRRPNSVDQRRAGRRRPPLSRAVRTDQAAGKPASGAAPAATAAVTAANDKRAIGFVRLGMSFDRSRSQLRDNLIGVLSVVGALVAVAILLTLLLTRRLVAPMRLLTGAATRGRRGQARHPPAGKIGRRAGPAHADLQSHDRAAFRVAGGSRDLPAHAGGKGHAAHQGTRGRDRAGVQTRAARHPHRPAEPRPAESAPEADRRAGGTRLASGGVPVPRLRSLQAHQRYAGTRRRRPAVAGGRAATDQCRARIRHRRPPGRRRVRDHSARARPGQGDVRDHDRADARARIVPRIVPPRRADADADVFDRRVDLPGRRRRSGRPDQAGRHRDVCRQGRRTQCVPLLHRGHEYACAGTPAARDRHAARPHGRRVLPRLSAADRHGLRPRVRRRGAACAGAIPSEA